MANVIDIKLTKDTSHLFDIGFDESTGDFNTVSGFETSITMSLYTDKRVTKDEVQQAENRRGWLGDELFESFTHGSKLWLLDQARLNFNTRNLASTYAKNSLMWMKDDGFLKELTVKSRMTGTNVTINIDGLTIKDDLNSWSYVLWKNVEGII